MLSGNRRLHQHCHCEEAKRLWQSHVDETSVSEKISPEGEIISDTSSHTTQEEYCTGCSPAQCQNKESCLTVCKVAGIGTFD